MGYFSSLPHNEDSSRQLAERVMAYAGNNQLDSMDNEVLTKRYLENFDLFKLDAQNEDDADEADELNPEWDGESDTD